MTFDQLFAEMETEDAVGVLLAAQLGQSPHELQIILRTTGFSPNAAGLQTKNNYVIALHNVIEHQISFGVFDEISLEEQHPLLVHHNAARVRVYIGSPYADSPVPIIQQIAEAHGAMFGDWRLLANDLDEVPKMERVFKAGYGTLGEMPLPFAAKVMEILTQYGIKNSMVNVRPSLDPPMKLLLIDESYFVAFAFEISVVSG